MVSSALWRPPGPPASLKDSSWDLTHPRMATRIPPVKLWSVFYLRKGPCSPRRRLLSFTLFS